MTQIEIVREFHADPASVALLLAGPSARALWPDDGTDDAGHSIVSIGPPMRSGLGFVVHLGVAAAPTTRQVRGRLALVPCGGPARQGGTRVRPRPGGTHVRLVLTSAGAPDHGLRARADGFLDALCSLAAARSAAA
jgi:hypothetical protein